MRMVLDHELLSLKETSQVLQVSRCMVDEMVESGQLTMITIGSQKRIEGSSINAFMACTCYNTDYDVDFDDYYTDASENEMEIIADWT